MVFKVVILRSASDTEVKELSCRLRGLEANIARSQTTVLH
jgi:hypothetical protein